MPILSRTVLCVDDDPDDREMICYTITEIDPTVNVVHAENGLEAIEYLEKAKVEDGLPCLIILDINMPKMDGKKTLAELKKDKELNTLPVVLFSTSNSQIDKLYCDQYGVELVTKPSDMKSIQQEIKKLLQYCAET